MRNLSFKEKYMARQIQDSEQAIEEAHKVFHTYYLHDDSAQAISRINFQRAKFKKTLEKVDNNLDIFSEVVDSFEYVAKFDDELAGSMLGVQYVLASHFGNTWNRDNWADTLSKFNEVVEYNTHAGRAVATGLISEMLYGENINRVFETYDKIKELNINKSDAADLMRELYHFGISDQEGYLETLTSNVARIVREDHGDTERAFDYVGDPQNATKKGNKKQFNPEESLAKRHMRPKGGFLESQYNKDDITNGERYCLLTKKPLKADEKGPYTDEVTKMLEEHNQSIDKYNNSLEN
ncbi:MAG: hypothetical protein GOU98_04525 [Candidatus Altiarchaeota archaeon]|nr:hypothetical protein [Candidatus Altiarchaeota archaeon]